MTERARVYVIDGRGAVGDTVSACWIAAGAREQPGLDIQVLCRHEQGSRGAAQLIRCLGATNPADQRLDLPPTASVSLGWQPGCERVMSLGVGGSRVAYTHQLRVGGSLGALECWQQVWPIRIQPAHPGVRVSRQALELASQVVEQRHQQTGGAPIVLLYPICRVRVRCWPIAHWLRLEQLLRSAGLDCIALDSHREPIRDFGAVLVGQPWDRQMALMSLADLVIANESGAAHVAGTVGVRTLVVCGPTYRACNLAYMGDHVQTISAERERIPCVGCHFVPYRGFSRSCYLGCEALHSLDSYTVARRAISWLADCSQLPQAQSTTCSTCIQRSSE